MALLNIAGNFQKECNWLLFDLSILLDSCLPLSYNQPSVTPNLNAPLHIFLPFFIKISSGRSNYSKPVTLIASRLSYSFAHGRRKGENFKARDIRPGGTLSFLKPGNPEPIYVRITAVEDYEPKSFDTWWGCPTGGALTEEERKDRKVLEGVQKLVKGKTAFCRTIFSRLF